MIEDTTLPFRFPSVSCKKVFAAFVGGRLSSAGGVPVLAEAARRLGIAERLANLLDMRNPARVIHPLSDILHAHILAIACGYEDATYLDSPRYDPAFKLDCGRLPGGRDFILSVDHLFALSNSALVSALSKKTALQC